MGIFSKSNKKNINESSEEAIKMRSLFTALSNLTSEDIENLENLAKGKVTRNAVESPTLSKYFGLVDTVINKNSMFMMNQNETQTRQQLYEIYDDMDDTIAYVSSALDILSDDATQPDDKDKIITVVAGSNKVQTLVEDMIEDLELEQRIAKWARVVAKYGDFFIQVFGEVGKGIVRVSDTVYPGYIERKEVDGRLIAFKDTEYVGTNQDNLYAPWEFVHFKHKGDIYKQRDVSGTFEGKNQYNLTASYGQSVLRSAVKVYGQLRFVENLILLSRLTNSIRRNIFLINVGDVAPDKAFETITNYANLLKKNVSLDLESGIYDAQKKTISYDEDIFIPTSDPKNDVRIEQVGGDVNIAEQYDLEYLLNKLFASLKIPKAYLNYEQDLNARSTLIQLDIRYARSVARLQQTLIGGLTRLAKIHLAFKGIDPDSVDLDIKLASVSAIDEDAKMEQQAKIAEQANTLWNTLVTINRDLTNDSQDSFGGMMGGTPEPKSDKLDLEYGAQFILKDILKFDEDTVNRIMKDGIYDDTENTKSAKKKLLPMNRVSDSNPKKYESCNSYTSDRYAEYPLESNIVKFNKLRESLAEKSVDNSDIDNK